MRSNIKHSTQCFITNWNTSKFVTNTLLLVVFSTFFPVFHVVIKHCVSCLMYYVIVGEHTLHVVDIARSCAREAPLAVQLIARSLTAPFVFHSKWRAYLQAIFTKTKKINLPDMDHYGKYVIVCEHTLYVVDIAGSHARESPLAVRVLSRLPPLSTRNEELARRLNSLKQKRMVN